MAQFLLFMVCFFSSAIGAAPLYTLADLEVLHNEGSYEEFFKHAMDVRPVERQDAWKAMVSKMGDAYGQGILKKAEISKKDFKTIESLYALPALKSDDVFRLKRQEVGIRYLKTCLKSENPCIDDLRAFWEKDQTDPEGAYKLAELTQNLTNSPYSSWTFLDVALKSNLSEFYCQKEFVMSTLWGKIEIDYIKLGPNGDLMTKIDQTIHPDCMPHLLTEARKRLYSPPKILDREVAFQVLKSQTKATQDIEDFFYTVYLLDNPSQGELFNYSWNRVRELGGTITRREEVLKKLKTLDPLPDSLLASLDQTKKRVVLNHFKTYFPEYLHHYADQCIEFYGGKGSFPSGNPTIHCQEFMNSELAPKVIDEFKVKRYLEAKKI